MDQLKSKYNLTPKMEQEAVRHTPRHDVTVSHSERKTALEALLITPHISIGALELGMSPE